MRKRDCHQPGDLSSMALPQCCIELRERELPKIGCKPDQGPVDSRETKTLDQHLQLFPQEKLPSLLPIWGHCSSNLHYRARLGHADLCGPTADPVSWAMHPV